MKKGNVLAVLLATVGIMLLVLWRYRRMHTPEFNPHPERAMCQPRLQRMSPAQSPPQKQVWGRHGRRKLP